jgi:hypothetical protein
MPADNKTTSRAIEIRSNDDGTLDEVVARGCDFHLEQMDDTCWWMGITMPDGETVHVNLFTARKARILGRAEHV